jgi:hypothetical protein
MSQATIAALEQGRRQASSLLAVALTADGPGLPSAERARLAEAAQHPGSPAGLPPAWVVR